LISRVAALDERGNTLGVAPTGAGKTVMLSAIAGNSPARRSAIILQHRDELVSQNRATFEKVNPRATTGLFTADRKEWGYDCTFRDGRDARQ
jgi:DNA repair protein RadD